MGMISYMHFYGKNEGQILLPFLFRFEIETRSRKSGVRSRESGVEGGHRRSEIKVESRSKGFLEKSLRIALR